MSLVLDNLLPALLQIFLLVLAGHISASYDMMPPGTLSVLGRWCSTFAQPALILNAIAKLDLGQANVGVLTGMLIAKVAVALLVYVIALYFAPGKTLRRSRAALFVMTTVSSNDFALGLPIIDALYGSDGGPSRRGSAPWPVRAHS